MPHRKTDDHNEFPNRYTPEEFNQLIKIYLDTEEESDIIATEYHEEGIEAYFWTNKYVHALYSCWKKRQQYNKVSIRFWKQIPEEDDYYIEHTKLKRNPKNGNQN